MIQGIISLEIGMLVDWWLRLILNKDSECRIHLNKELYVVILIYCVAVGGWIENVLVYWNWYGQLACGILAAYLLVASIQDKQSCEVYDLLHILALPAGIMMLLLEAPGERVVSLLLFIAVQLGIFMRMYGAGDGFAFIVCAVYESRFGSGMMTYLLHMAAVFASLAVIQGIRGNIAGNGNLRKAVPLMPYIAATVWLFL